MSLMSVLEKWSTSELVDFRRHLFSKNATDTLRAPYICYIKFFFSPLILFSSRSWGQGGNHYNKIYGNIVWLFNKTKTNKVELKI